MFTQEALDLIQRTAVQARGVSKGPTELPTLVLPNREGGIGVIDAEPWQKGRSRFRGMYSTNTLAEFVNYVKARADALGNTPTPPDPPGLYPISVFVNAENDSAESFFNLGSIQSPGHADDRARLTLRKTAAFAALLKIIGNPWKQRQLAEFCEDWFDVMSPIYGGDNPDQPSMTKAIAAIRDITIASKAEANSVQGDMNASRSALEEIEAKSKKQLPYGFSFATAPYDGFIERTFALRLSVLPQEKEPLLAVRIVGLGDVTERIGQEFEKKVRDGLPGVAVYRGAFSP